MSQKAVPLDEMRRAIHTTGPPPGDTPPSADGWGLHPEAIDAAQAEDEDALATVLGREGLGGRIAARLLIAAVQAERTHRELADKLSALTESVDRSRCHLDALKSMAPTTPDEATKRADALDLVTKSYCVSANQKGRAEMAKEYVRWLHSYFPALFGCSPEIVRKVPRISGQVPPEVAEWFRENEVEPDEYDSWKCIGRTEPGRRRKLISTAAAVNENRERN